MQGGESEGYRFLEHVTDMMVEAWGPTVERAFAQSGIALYETMLNVERVRPQARENISVQGHDELELLYNWLEALLLKFELENKALSKFEVQPIKKNDEHFLLEAIAFGELYDQDKHGRKVGVKGVTYHQMAVEQGNRPRVRFLLDL